MDKDEKIRLTGLLRRLISYDARTILTELGKHTPVKNRFPIDKTSPETTKKDLKELIARYPPQSQERLMDFCRRYSIKYLEGLMKHTDEEINPSYSVLRSRIESGEYNIGKTIGL